ncbi:SLC13 family permease [Pseudomaricurvus alcaniphilus]|uniref:SLC13 family permease n=1 Tax=Pseudomaricurvus alcaniphilus TaxID=1166482 RepID=UPI00140CA494|nr:SLC13 family permease [Pseudomaricurvus alcaniphilus]NHN39570.1 SLC13 family permease [Pseudomaricurvus alcaniphilus]
MEEYAAYYVACNLVALVALLVFTRMQPWMIFLGSSCLMYMLGVMPLEELLSGYTNPSLLVLVMLYFVSIPMERTSMMRRMTSYVASASTRQSVFRLGLFSGCFSAFVNNTAVVAAMLGPLTRQRTIPASRLLLPLSYASILGGTLTLIGTSTNLIVNSFVLQSGFEPLGFFEFTSIGLPVFFICLGVMTLLAPTLLPKNKLQEQAQVQEYFLERRIMPGSPLAGRSVQENGLRQLERIFLVEVIREHHVMAPVSPQEVLQEGDTLVFTGDLSAIELLDDFDGLGALEMFDQQVRDNLVEVIVSPTAALVGRSIKEVDFRARFDAAVVAVRRGNQRLAGGLGQLELEAGDALVLAVGDDFSRRRDISADFIVVGGVEYNRVLTRPREVAIFAAFGVIVALGATGFVPLLKGLILLLAVLLFSRTLTLEDLRARFPYQLFVVIGSALALSQAMFQTGLADNISQLAGDMFSGLSPVGALIGVFILTWLFTELVTNNAAAAIMFPIAIAISGQWGHDYLPFVMAVAFGASASFLSPFGYQTNLMVYTAGNYRVKDYLKFGLPVLLAYSTVALTMISWLYQV